MKTEKRVNNMAKPKKAKVVRGKPFAGFYKPNAKLTGGKALAEQALINAPTSGINSGY